MIAPPAALLALAALLPAMTGPVGSAPPDGLVMALCGGGTIEAPLPGGAPEPASAPCCAKGCHAGGRKRLDRGQCA